jgi:phenylalanyl-tRNA synthetase beta chain
MRPTLLPGLLEALRHNFNHGTRDVRLFETGRVFAAGDEGEEARPNEVEAFALVVTGEALEEGRATGAGLDFYDLKGALESAADAMRVGGLEFEPGSVRHLREGQSARVS